MTAYCEFGTFLDDALCERFIWGMYVRADIQALVSRKGLEAIKISLTTHSAEPITPLGKVDELVTYNAQQAILLIVVAATGPSLLGRNWLTTIRLDWKSIGSIFNHSPLAQLLEKYINMFKGCLGKLVGHDA